MDASGIGRLPASPAVTDVALLPKQMAMIQSDLKVYGARGGVGSGKTYTNAWWIIIMQGIYPKAAFFVVGATFPQVHLGFYETLKGLCDKYKIAYKYTSSPRPRFVFLDTGAVIETLSSEMREQIRSLEADFVVVEEPQTWDNGKDTFLTLVERLRPSPRAIANYPGLMPKVRLTFNPPPVGHWLHALFEKQWRGVYPCIAMSLRDNTILHKIEPSYLPFLLQTIPSERWPREIDGEWGTVATGVYRGFDAEINTIQGLREDNEVTPIPAPLPPFALIEGEPLCWSLDFNVGWMASVVGQWHRQPMTARIVAHDPPHEPTWEVLPTLLGYQERVLYVLREFFLGDSGIQNVVQAFLHVYGDFARRNGLRLYGDASGNNRQSGIDANESARSNWAIAVRDLRAAGIEPTWCVQTQNPSQIDRVNMTREQFNVNGRVGMVVDADTCPQLIDDINLVQFVPGKNDIDKTDKSEDGVKRTHTSDALGYMCWWERTVIDMGDAVAPGDEELQSWMDR